MPCVAAEVADIICSFPDYLPVVVLSAMGKLSTEQVPGMPPLRAVRDLHLHACKDLGIEADMRTEVERLLNELQQLLIGICIMQDLTPRAKDSLVSFGERLSTRIFASFLRVQGVAAKQYDAWELGMVTTDDFTNADVIYDEALPRIRAALTAQQEQKELPIVTGFLGRGSATGAITTLGRGGTDLTATVLGAALQLPEVQVWKDVDGVLTSDPRLVPHTRPVTELTFEEATELAYFGAQVLHPQAMQPAIRSGTMGVRVKHSYNRSVSVSLTLDPKKLPDIESELGQLKLDLDKIATVSYRRNLAIVSLICNVQRTSRILENVSYIAYLLLHTPLASGSCTLLAHLPAQLLAWLLNQLCRYSLHWQVRTWLSHHLPACLLQPHLPVQQPACELAWPPGQPSTHHPALLPPSQYARCPAPSPATLLTCHPPHLPPSKAPYMLPAALAACPPTQPSPPTPPLLATQVFDVLDSCGINVVMMSQGASKTNISLVVEGADGQTAVLALHMRFFEGSSHV
ncbi:Aspartate/glutamate/uridylate kinase [Haematococcus lacustris]